MSFRCDAATLVRLEWPRLLARLAHEAATTRAAERLREPFFAESRAGARDWLAETSEAHRLLDDGGAPPFSGALDLRPALADLARDRALDPRGLADVLATLEALRRLRAALASETERAPRLAALAATLPSFAPLEDALRALVTTAGEVRADASPELVRLRRRNRELETEIDARMARWLRDPDVQAHLQDSYATIRENRPVLPVRAEARQRVRGIVHDVSSSGTTVFIEPEEVVEAGNRLRLAQLELAREVERLLRQGSEAVHARALELEAALGTLTELDVAFARARLSRRYQGVPPDVSDSARIELHALRHPLLLLEGALAPEAVVANDVRLGDARCLVLSGPNAGGKTVAAKATALAALSVRAGLFVAAEPGSAVPLFDSVFAEIGDEQDLRAGLSTFSARMANLAAILAGADSATFVLADEIGEGTEPGEGAALAQSILEALVARGATVLATTHFNRLKELGGSDPRFLNASAEFDPQTLAPTFRIHLGQPGSSGAMWAAQRMGLAPEVVERGRELLDRDDARLEMLTRGLSELRQELETERRVASRMREETEVTRAAYEARLASLRSAREQALAAMKVELEDAFKRARAEIAHVVRGLQAGGEAGPARGRAANQAHGELVRIRERTAKAEAREALDAPKREPVPAAALVAGARVELVGVRGIATVVSAPDKRGRLEVRTGGARTFVEATRVARVLEPERPKPVARVSIERADDEAPSSLECDLRGLRVDEALDRADATLQRLLGRGAGRIVFIHGHGTGALRNAIRAWLGDVRGIEKVAAGEPREGGNGVTIATLA